MHFKQSYRFSKRSSSTENDINTQLAKAWTAIDIYRTYESQPRPIK